MALIALLWGMPSNVDAQAIIPKSRFSARNVAPQVREHNVLALFCMMEYYESVSSFYGRSWSLEYPTGTPLYFLTNNSRSIIKINGYKKVSKFGETTKGDLAWTRECSYENGQLKNIRYSNGDVDIYEYDVLGRIVRVTLYDSEGDYHLKKEFSAYGNIFYNGSMKFEIKDDGYYLSGGRHGNCDRGCNYSYGDATYRYKHTVNMQAGYVERVSYWRYKELTMKGRLAGKKYDWHYSNSETFRFDPECCFFPNNDYIVEYEEVL